MLFRTPAAPDPSQPGVSAVLNKPYPDFVAFLGQHNTPPGAFRTIDEWVRLASVERDSRILDLACTTGYSGRNAHELTGAAVHGIDISADAVEQARVYAAGNRRLTYEVADAAELPLPDDHFSHVLGGCNFGFIQERDRALDEVHRVLQPGGLLCTATFYYRQRPPESLLDQVAHAIGVRPDGARDREFWDGFFSKKFKLVNGVQHDIPPLGARKVTRIVRKSVYGRTPALAGVSRSVRDACFHRLHETRRDTRRAPLLPRAGDRYLEGASVIAENLRTRAVSARLPTPFYLFDLPAIESTTHAMAEAWQDEFPHFTLAYSYKTNALPGITTLLRSCGAAAEVVSGAELAAAFMDGFTPDEIYFDGPVKLQQELTDAVAAGVSVQADSLAEVEELAGLARQGHAPRVCLRLAVRRGRRRWSRFGLLPDEFAEARRTLGKAGVPVRGVHFNTGLHPLDPTPYRSVLRQWRTHLQELLAQAPEPLIIDIGGGFPATSCAPGSELPPWSVYARGVAEECRSLGLPPKEIRMVIEPGRSLVEDHAVLVASVAVRKKRLRRLGDAGRRHKPCAIDQRLAPSRRVRGVRERRVRRLRVDVLRVGPLRRTGSRAA
ncbi:methyltransferase domain-containing protein [Kitasatospora sp. NBC_00039]|uniref:methyltransferase domain-containing protein n=1 Tax=Kitasatospora sp. NBC_00039 TaxID=2903565 RepID=UPI00325333DD